MTFAPSFPTTLAPTRTCGACTVQLDLVLMTDDFPSETTWTLTSDDLVRDCSVEVSASGGPFDAPRTRVRSTLSVQLCEHQRYTFTIADSYGDGMCCAFGAGW